MMISKFKFLVIAASLAHGIVLLVLPRLPLLFSPDAMELMKYGGHGAHVAMSHPVLYVLYLLPFAAFVGLYQLRNWGRFLLSFYLIVTLIGSFFFGVSISAPPETFFGDISLLADGAIAGMMFLSPLKEEFSKPIDASGSDL